MSLLKTTLGYLAAWLALTILFYVSPVWALVLIIVGVFIYLIYEVSDKKEKSVE